MMKNLKKSPLLTTAACTFVLLALPASAQDVCAPDQNWSDCLTGLLNQGNTFKMKATAAQAERSDPVKKAAAEDQSAETVADALVGAATSSEANMEDFISSLLSSLDISGLESSSGGLKFKKNYQVTYGTLAVEGLARKSELFAELETKLEASGEKDLIDDLDDELGDFDDVNVNIVFSVDRYGGDNAIWWGRRFRGSNGKKTPNGVLATQLYDKIASAPLTRYKAAEKAFTNALGTNALTLVKDTQPATLRADLQAKAKAVADAAQADIEGLSTALKTERYFSFSKLVANQPQFILTAGYNARDELVGRDSWSASVKYELGRANVNGLRRACSELTLECYSDFLDQQKTALTKNWRVSFEGTYSQMQTYDYTSPDGMVSLKLDEAQNWNVMLSAGRTLRLTDEGLELTRFDLEAAYEDVSGDTQKQARFVSTATFTQRISDTMSVAAGVVYANRPEYLGQVDEELSARAGLKLKLVPKSGSS